MHATAGKGWIVQAVMHTWIKARLFTYNKACTSLRQDSTFETRVGETGRLCIPHFFQGDWREEIKIHVRLDPLNGLNVFPALAWVVASFLSWLIMFPRKRTSTEDYACGIIKLIHPLNQLLYTFPFKCTLCSGIPLQVQPILMATLGKLTRCWRGESMRLEESHFDKITREQNSYYGVASFQGHEAQLVWANVEKEQDAFRARLWSKTLSCAFRAVARWSLDFWGSRFLAGSMLQQLCFHLSMNETSCYPSGMMPWTCWILQQLAFRKPRCHLKKYTTGGMWTLSQRIQMLRSRADWGPACTKVSLFFDCACCLCLPCPGKFYQLPSGDKLPEIGTWDLLSYNVLQQLTQLTTPIAKRPPRSGDVFGCALFGFSHIISSTTFKKQTCWNAIP